ncbi:hypothetical protein ACFSZS_25030 [Seohaeicola zhoushanensis]
MADDASAALKLAKENEKQINLLWKNFAKLEKTQNEWEKLQQDYIQRIEKNLIDAINDANKQLVAYSKSIDEHEKAQASTSAKSRPTW